MTAVPRRAQYDESMTRRITVSLPDHLVEAATAAVEEGRAASVSAYVAEALTEKAARETLADFLADWREQVGPESSEEDGWAQSVLGLDDRAR